VAADEPLKGHAGLTLRWSPLDATAEEQKTFDAAHDGMRGGWGGTFERLTAYKAQSCAGLSDAKSGRPVPALRFAEHGLRHGGTHHGNNQTKDQTLPVVRHPGRG